MGLWGDRQARFAAKLLHRSSGRFGPLAPDPLGIAEGDVARLHSNIEILGRYLRDEAFYSWPEPDPAASHLRAVGAGLDWLAAHVAQQAAQRLPDATVAELSIAADHSAVAHLFTARLIEHTRDLLTSDPVAQGVLGAAGGALRAAARAWQQAATSWKPDFGSAPDALSPRLVREAEFAVVRLGRYIRAGRPGSAGRSGLLLGGAPGAGYPAGQPVLGPVLALGAAAERAARAAQGGDVGR
ncbi:hypothetical protein [Kitasatospora sp. NPDC001132]